VGDYISRWERWEGGGETGGRLYKQVGGWERIKQSFLREPDGLMGHFLMENRIKKVSRFYGDFFRFFPGCLNR
jgi:hypothetical protein